MFLIAAFGNPLLDITVKIKNKTLLEKYNLNEDDQTEIPAHVMKFLINDIHCMNPRQSAGGAAQNTLRVLQWVLTNAHSTIMFGSIGDDRLGERVKTLVEAAGVQTRYAVSKHEPTGSVVALIKGANRSLVAYLGAAQYTRHEDIDASYKDLKKATLVYMEGFFLPQRRMASEHVQKFCTEKGKIFAFNISAVYMAKTYPEDVWYFAKKADILIGNFKEYQALIEAANLTYDVLTFATQMCRNYKNDKCLKYGKMVIITNGAETVMCMHNDGVLAELDVPKIDAKQIGDTTGAGDAFAAGFFAGMLKGRDPRSCLKWGCWVSQQIIKQVGCTIPDYSALEFLENIGGGCGEEDRDDY